MSERPKLVCLTPIKNEAWILERFLACASRWADHIIVADQQSDDGSREIAERFEKVTLIENRATTFNEPERQKLLIDAARRIEGPKILIALDADEFFRADFIESAEWQRMLEAPPGTVIDFTWACALPDSEHYYEYASALPLGFVDDGSPHEGVPIHSPRVPVPEQAPHLEMGVTVMHFSTIDEARFRSKTRWYQCYEFLSGKWEGRFFELYRFYHAELCIAPSRLKKIPAAWADGYGPEIDLLNIPEQDYYRWDREMLKLFDQHGTDKFRRLAIWDVDWNEMNRKTGGGQPSRSLDDPRSWLEKWVHRWLDRTQIYYVQDAPRRNRLAANGHAVIRKWVKKMGW